jgi:hypothetical protein
MSLDRQRLIPVLAHELQHVREVIDAGIGYDAAAFDALFARSAAASSGLRPANSTRRRLHNES